MTSLRNSAVRSYQFGANRQIVPGPLETPVAASIHKAEYSICCCQTVINVSWVT